MSKRPNTSQLLALDAARAVGRQEEDEDQTPNTVAHPDPKDGRQPAELKNAPSPKKGGRPKGRREVEARVTLYLDAPRHSALQQVSTVRSQSMHRVILDCIDIALGRPTPKLDIDWGDSGGNKPRRSSD